MQRSIKETPSMLVKITPDLLVIDKNESREIHQLKNGEQ